MKKGLPRLRLRESRQPLLVLPYQLLPLTRVTVKLGLLLSP